MNPQNNYINQENQQNATPINLGKGKMVWVWISLLGGFVIVIILIAILLYQSKTKKTTNQPTDIKKTVEQKSNITPADEKIDQEVTNIDVGNLDNDFQDVEKDINQL